MRRQLELLRQRQTPRLASQHELEQHHIRIVMQERTIMHETQRRYTTQQLALTKVSFLPTPVWFATLHIKGPTEIPFEDPPSKDISLMQCHRICISVPTQPTIIHIPMVASIPVEDFCHMRDHDLHLPTLQDSSVLVIDHPLRP